MILTQIYLLYILFEPSFYHYGRFARTPHLPYAINSNNNNNNNGTNNTLQQWRCIHNTELI